jgi:predicted RNA-binding Zn ribbon-like protein
MVISTSKSNSYTSEVTPDTRSVDHPLAIADGSLCLDFANTLDARRAPQTKESLTSYADLVAWCEQVGICRSEEAQDLLAESTANPAAARTALERAIDLREAIYRVFAAVAANEPPASADLAVLRDAYAAAVASARFVPNGSLFVWDWSAGLQLDWPLGPVAQSAVELLLSDDLSRVKTCNADACGWIFLDTSKNGSRRWCSMETCGSRMKMRRHYARKKAGTTKVTGEQFEN